MYEYAKEISKLCCTGAADDHIACARRREEAGWGELVLGARTRLFCLLLRAADRRSRGCGGGGGRVGGLRCRLDGGGLLLRRAAGSVHLELALLESGQRGRQIGSLGQRVLPEEVRVERFVRVDPHLWIHREQPIEQLERQIVAHERAQLLLHHALQICSKHTILIRTRLAFR